MNALLLSKEHPELPLWEAKEFLKLKKYEVQGNVLLFKKSLKNTEHLAMSKLAGKVLITCKKEALEAEIKKLGKKIKGSFSIRCEGNRALAQQLAQLLKEASKQKINLTKPENELLLFLEKEAILIKVEKHIKHDFEKRKNHLLPQPHPSGAHPKLARVMSNLLGPCKTVHDPFCGSGGTLIEAGLAHKTIKGSDIDPIMIKRAAINLKHFNLKATLKVKDATTIKSVPYIVTDLPYGKNTKATALMPLYTSFLKDLTYKKAVIGYPNTIDDSFLPKKRVKKIFTLYIHKSLSKKIALLE